MDIDAIRKLCLSLPAAAESVKWDSNLVFSVGEKMFCMLALEPPFQCSFKVKDEDFDALSHTTGFKPAAYLARAQWVTTANEAGLHRREWEQHIRQSYELVKAKLPKKVKEQLGI